MDKTAKDLLEKIALSPGTVGRAFYKRVATAPPVKGHTALRDVPQKTIERYDNAIGRMSPQGKETAQKATDTMAKDHAERNARTQREKKSSMKNIIDDIIKGAEHNSFGRPVTIQTDTEWTHLDTAKTAGILHALGEQGYSVKQAAEYLRLTESQVQSIVATVR